MGNNRSVFLYLSAGVLTYFLQRSQQLITTTVFINCSLKTLKNLKKFFEIRVVYLINERRCVTRKS